MRWKLDTIGDKKTALFVINLQSFAQKDPKVEFRLKSYELFDEMIQNIVNETLKTLFNARFEDVLD